MRLSFAITTTCISLVVTILLVSSFSVSHAQVRSSNNYQLQSDSINVGGGLSNSASYVQESTVGEIATGPSDSTNFSLKAGYQQMQEVFLSLAGGGPIVMDVDLPGITGGTSNGSTTFTVVTDSPAGYQLTIEAENDPAMQRTDGASIADYTEVGSADFTFSVPAATAEFGFTPEGDDIASAYKDNGASCGVGTGDTAFACWTGLTTSATEIARGVGSNHPLGATTSVHFRVGISSGANVETGVYYATTTVTALPL